MKKNNSKKYTLSAIILGYLMIGDYTANEQNAIGNWFMTIGQILEANAAIEMSLNNNSQNLSNMISVNKEIIDLKKEIEKIIKKLDKL